MRFSGQVRSAFLLSIAAGLLLAALQLGWLYVANTADLVQVSRDVAKNMLFGSGVALVLLVAARIAVRSSDGWVGRVSSTIALMMAVAWGVTLATLAIVDGRPSGNPAIISESVLVRLLAAALALAIYVLVVIGPCLLVGYLARQLARVWRRTASG
jgi:hypothetical protein